MDAANRATTARERAARKTVSITLALVWIIFAWFVFVWTHELGHVAGALVTGGEVDRVVLHPFRFSRTDVWPNPRPLVVVWAGPLLGSAFACVASLALLALGHIGVTLCRATAGFAMIANGLYISSGVVVREADPGDMLDLGTPIYVLPIYGCASFVFGLWLWRWKRPLGGLTRELRPIVHASLHLTLASLVMALAGWAFFPGP